MRQVDVSFFLPATLESLGAAVVGGKHLVFSTDDWLIYFEHDFRFFDSLRCFYEPPNALITKGPKSRVQMNKNRCGTLLQLLKYLLNGFPVLPAPDLSLE